MARILQEDLPPAPSIRWTARRKAAVVLAVARGRLSIEEVQRRYAISQDEFLEWQRRAALGLRALSATRRIGTDRKGVADR
jgi:hypothetical protein